MSQLDPPTMNSGDMAWMLASTALVQLMTPGLAFFYGGLVNEGAVVNTLMLSYATMGVITLMWGLVGYSLAFAPSIASGVVGDLSLAASIFGNQARAIGAPTITEHTYMVFQLMFAIITAAIISGGVVQKIKFQWFLLFVAIWHVLVYCPLAHWIFYANGWLFTYGSIDFAGGMVVHTSSGVSAFVLAFWLGKSKIKNRPHNVPYVLLGAALLWFGWFGFNAGSAGAANSLAARAFVNTQYATAIAMLSWNAFEIIFSGPALFKGYPTAVGAACGAICGLVGITPACGFVSNMWAYFIGFFTALVVFFTPRLLKPLGVDDRLDCFAFHGIGGITGSLLTGLFASMDQGDSTVNGAFYFNAPLYGYQIVSVLVTVLLSVTATTVIYWTLWALAKALGTDMRIHEDDQHDVDASQHGETAYNKAVEMDSASVDAFTDAQKSKKLSAKLAKATTAADATAAPVAEKKKDIVGEPTKAEASV